MLNVRHICYNCTAYLPDLSITMIVRRVVVIGRCLLFEFGFHSKIK